MKEIVTLHMQEFIPKADIRTERSFYAQVVGTLHIESSNLSVSVN